MDLGYILQPTYRITAGRPVVHLYGSLARGGSFLVRDDRETPQFYILAKDAAQARNLGARVGPDTPVHRDLTGRPAVPVTVSVPSDTPPLRDRLHRSGIPTYEADVRFAYRYLITRAIRGTVGIEGDWEADAYVDRVYTDPRLTPASFVPQLRPLSIDIETDPDARGVLSIALAYPGGSDVLLLCPPGSACPAGATRCANEGELLTGLLARVRTIDPDVIVGWNVIDFDLDVLDRVASRVGVSLLLGRGDEPLRFRTPRGAGLRQAVLPGRLVLDGIQLLRGAFVRLESYSLQEASRVILGKGKTVADIQGGAWVLEAFRHDREALVRYNLRDAELVLEILDRLDLLPLTVERSRLTGMPPDRVSASIASFDFLYLSELAKRDLVAPTVGSRDPSAVEGTGGHVLEPVAGLYRNVAVMDFKSLYPSVIRTFQIDPLGLTSLEAEPDGIVAPNGAVFRREPGILPKLLDELMPRREAAKRQGNSVASQAIKILMNSFYGVLGTSACRFADPALANATTGFGREILLWSKEYIESRGLRVLYGDTDSLFVETGVPDAEEALAIARDTVACLNRELTTHIASTWKVTSGLELEFERLYVRLFLPTARHRTSGARKRYAGLVHDSGEDRVVFTGMEVVRTDWTDLARQVQRELYTRLFHDRAVEDYLSGVVASVRAGELDPTLVYRKALRKSLGAYTASTPPHVAAARKLSTRPGRRIEYVMTRQGPEPLAERRSPLDYEHYVQKQVRPVAEPVLSLLGLEFDRVIGDDRQTTLF